MGFPRQEHCNGLPFPTPGDLPDPGIEPRSPALQADSLPSEPPGNSDLDSWLSLSQPGFNPWSRNGDPASCAAKKKKRRNHVPNHAERLEERASVPPRVREKSKL